MILDSILDNFRKFNCVPSPELLDYAISCDSFAQDKISTNEFLKEVCLYLDESAIRLQALSASINRYKEPHMGDVFTESINMMVTAILNHPIFDGCDWKVSSEYNFYLNNGRYIKPDVGIYRDGKLFSAFECKSNLGYDRIEWEKSFGSRVDLYSDNGLKDNAVFLIVATESNWSGFPAHDIRTGKSWFLLANKGTWYGGKNNNKPLHESPNFGVIDRVMEALIEIA